MRYGENVLRRGDRWFFRCRVPSEFVQSVGKREVVYALGTSNRDVARYLASAIRLRLGQMWRGVGDMRDKPKHVITEIAKRWFQRELDAAYRRFHDGSEFSHALPEELSCSERRRESARLMGLDSMLRIDVLSQERRDRDYSRANLIAEGMLKEFGLDADVHSQRFQVLARYIVEAEALVEEARFRWSEDEDGYRPKLPDLPDELFPAPQTRRVQRNVERKSEPPEPPPHTPVPVLDLVNGYADEAGFLEKGGLRAPKNSDAPVSDGGERRRRTHYAR